MAREPQESTSVAVPGIFVLLAGALASLYFLHSSLETSRPTEPVAVTTEGLGSQQIDARLWQDPFEALQRARRESNANPGEWNLSVWRKLSRAHATMMDLRAQIRERFKSGQSVMVLPVMVESGPYAEDRENRMRHRYAVLAALGVAGYVPSDGEHIGFVGIPWETERELTNYQRGDRFPLLCRLAEYLHTFESLGAEVRELDVPYEWQIRYVPHQAATTHAANQVLILWLEEDAFGDQPLTRLAMLMRQLGFADMSRDFPRQAMIRVLGPASSTTLRAATMDDILRRPQFNLARELRAAGDDGLEIYSFSATTAEEDLRSDVKPDEGSSTASPDFGHLGQNPMLWRLPARGRQLATIVRTSGTDERLAEALADELDLRGFDWANDRIAVIAEWDTIYGRTLPLEMAASVRQRLPSGPVDRRNWVHRVWDGNETWPPQIYRYSYLRGLDGRLPGDSKSTPPSGTSGVSQVGATRSPADDAAQPARQGAVEQPQGAAQLDYLRRVAADLVRRDVEHRVKAIGVLGSDVYDKLIALRALHDVYPDAIFFTTDLDARLLDKSQLTWTRNLIVASNYGLNLRDADSGQDVQRFAPPFRDAYQSALFVSALAALDRIPEDALLSSRPRLFEVGRHSVVDLSPQDIGPSVQVPRPGLRDWLPFFKALLPLLLALALALYLLTSSSIAIRRMLPSLPGVRFPNVLHARRTAAARNGGVEPKPFNANNLRTKLRRQETLAVLAAFVCFVVFMIIYVSIVILDSTRENGEPFRLAEGVSIWPTEAIRLGVIFLAAVLLIHAYYTMRWSNLDLGLRYRLRPIAPRATALSRRCVRRLWQLVQSWWRTHPAVWERTPKPATVNEAWAQYLTAGYRWNRAWRVLCMSASYIAFGILLGVLLGWPVVPFRGEISRWTDHVLLWTSVVLMVVITFFVIDVVRLCQIFSFKLAGPETRWSKATLRKFAAEWPNVPRKTVEKLLDVRMIAERTSVLAPMLYYPFVILAGMILSRTQLFDRWNWPISLVVIFGLNAIYTVVIALMLRRTAETVRRDAIQGLNRSLLSHPTGVKAERTKLIIDEIRLLREGTFAAYSQNPVFAMLLPLSSVLLIKLGELLNGP